jgi:hypothetical protein
MVSQLGIVVPTCNPSYLEAEVGESRFEGSLSKKYEPLSEKQTKKQKDWGTIKQ